MPNWVIHWRNIDTEEMWITGPFASEANADRAIAAFKEEYPADDVTLSEVYRLFAC